MLRCPLAKQSRNIGVRSSELHVSVKHDLLDDTSTLLQQTTSNASGADKQITHRSLVVGVALLCSDLLIATDASTTGFGRFPSEAKSHH
eukprot:210987-Amphidinium_carterae.1